MVDCINSEMIVIKTARTATIAGTVSCLILAFGSNGVFLWTTNVMTASSVLAISKLFYPDTEN